MAVCWPHGALDGVGGGSGSGSGRGERERETQRHWHRLFDSTERNSFGAGDVTGAERGGAPKRKRAIDQIIGRWQEEKEEGRLGNAQSGRFGGPVTSRRGAPPSPAVHPARPHAAPRPTTPAARQLTSRRWPVQTCPRRSLGQNNSISPVSSRLFPRRVWFYHHHCCCYCCCCCCCCCCYSSAHRPAEVEEIRNHLRVE